MNKITLIKTDKCCFVTDCNSEEGFDYEYHETNITRYFFDGKKAKKSFAKNWYIIEKYPSLIEEKEPDKKVNIRYELINNDLESKRTPLVIEEKDWCFDYEEPEYGLYKKKHDVEKGKNIEVDVKLEIMLELENFNLPPVFKYKANKGKRWGGSEEYVVTNADVNHQGLDKIILPEVLLHERPCSIDSSTLYNVIRAHVKENIDNSVAKVTSDYKFCFEVKKLIPHIVPKKYTYHNLFASTKKARQKLHTGVEEYKESVIFEMTPMNESYKSYTVLQPITAKNQNELKKKIDAFLEDLMHHINRKLEPCPHCNGNGFTEKVEKFTQNS